MRMYDLLEKKKNGGILTKEEIDFMIQGYTHGDIPDYQMSAMTMAICFQGMNPQETGDLTHGDLVTPLVPGSEECAGSRWINIPPVVSEIRPV